MSEFTQRVSDYLGAGLRGAVVIALGNMAYKRRGEKKESKMSRRSGWVYIRKDRNPLMLRFQETTLINNRRWINRY